MELSLFLFSSLIVSFVLRCVLTHLPSCGFSLYSVVHCNFRGLVCTPQVPGNVPPTSNLYLAHN